MQEMGYKVGGRGRLGDCGGVP